MFGKTWSYTALPATEDPEQYYTTEKSRIRSGSRKILLQLTAALILFAITVVTYLTWSQLTTALDLDLPCGTTADEARARGCIFELTGSSWVTPECYDPVTEQEFLDYKDWHWFKDYNYTDEAPLEEVCQGNGNGYFVPPEYHQTHCAFLLKKLHRAVNSGRKVDGLIKAIGHTSHCIEWMLDPPEDYFKLAQFAYTKFPNCGKEGGFNLDGSKLKPETKNGVSFQDIHMLPDHQHDHED